MRSNLPKGHNWVRRKIIRRTFIRRKLKVDGQAVFHRQCRICRRDFVLSAEVGAWRAAHVGLLGFDFLGEETNQRWLSEECPRRQVPEEINDLRKCREPRNSEIGRLGPSADKQIKDHSVNVSSNPK
jgi:hypothetical protein